MDQIEKRELKRQAWMRLAAQRRRAGLLRGRVVVISLICFVLLWGIVFTQMATGNDPVLAAKGKATKSKVVATRAPVEDVEPEAVEEVEAEPREEFVEEEPLLTSQS